MNDRSRVLLGTHNLEPVPFPGDECGYLPGLSRRPGDLVGFFPVGVQVYRCARCGELFQPVAEDLYSAPADPTAAPHVRVSFGSTTREMIETHPN